MYLHHTKDMQSVRYIDDKLILQSRSLYFLTQFAVEKPNPNQKITSPPKIKTNVYDQEPSGSEQGKSIWK